MIIYRCENVNCAKDFTQATDLKKVIVEVNEKAVEYALCASCCEKFTAHIDVFFTQKPQGAGAVGIGGTNGTASV